MHETIGAPQGKNKADSKWLNVSVGHLEKTAASLRRYEEKKKAEKEAKKKEGKIKIKIFF